MSRAFVALGANLGDPAATLAQALRDLDHVERTRVTGRSRFYCTPAVGPGPQPDYVNAVASVETALPPRRLLEALHAIEARHGRVRDGARWGPRTLDLDLLIYDELALSEPGLRLPHPEMTRRGFVLVPLVELAPDVVIPGFGPAAEALRRAGSAGIVPLDAAGEVDCGARSDEE